MRSKTMFALLIVAQLFWVGGAWAQLTPPTPQFFFTGFIQEATLDTAGTVCPLDLVNDPNGRLRGGTVAVNGVKMIVPCNTLLQLPAATMTWADLFDPNQSAPVGSYIGAPAVVPANPIIGGLKTGLALADNPMPFPSFDVSVAGNVVPDPAGGPPRYIVGLIAPIENQVLNASSGLISYIDYTNGSFRVGGIPNDPTTGVLVQINDPVGRWGLIHSPDPRFSGDFENSTVSASTGIPVCIPRVPPPGDDPLCPLGNRPLNGDSRFPTTPFLPLGAPLKIFDMPPPPGQPGADPSGFPDATKQVPMMVGDQVDYIGTLYKIDPLKTMTDPITGATIPDNTAANSYISAHTVNDNLGIFTAPGVPPAYVFIEAFLIGSNGAAVQGIPQEASTRLTVVGFTTDPTRFVEIYAQDVNPCTGQPKLRFLATEDPAVDAIRGRFVHRVLGGAFMPPTRNYTIRSQTQLIDPDTGQRLEQIVANGIVAGEFSLPNFEYVFPENHRIGDPFIPLNFQDIPFLALGSGPVDGPGTGSPILGQLNPWPGIPTPAAVNCSNVGTPPVVNAGPDTAVSAGAQVLLAATVTWDSNSDPTLRTTTWTQTAGTAVAIQNPTALIASFIAPATPGLLTFTLTATDNIGTTTDTVTIIVTSPADIVQITVGTWVIQKGKVGPFGKLSVTATSTDPTASLSLIEFGVDGSVHSDLARMVADRSFREDLFYRLNVIPVQLPPLRDRREDIPILVQHFLLKIGPDSGRPNVTVSQEALRRLMAYPWPGNVRQLENAVERALAFSHGRTQIDVQDLSPEIQNQAAAADAAEMWFPDDGVDFERYIEGVELSLIRRSLERTQGNKRQAAKLLNLKRTTLIEKLKRLDPQKTQTGI